MRATNMYGAGDVRVEDVPDSGIKQPTDALVRISASAICGSDLWPYGSMSPADGPARMGHEFIGVVEDTGSEVSTVKKGDLVVCPFAVSDGTCESVGRGFTRPAPTEPSGTASRTRALRPKRSGSRSPTAPSSSCPSPRTRRSSRRC
jgi:threonine dehydrogenase-like Zn-dependent dehydrogenase